MQTLILPYFGKISEEAIQLFSDKEEQFILEIDTQLNGYEITMDIDAEDNGVSIEQLLKIKSFLENLPTFEKAIKQYIKNDFMAKNNEDIQLYIHHHLEEFDIDTLAEIIDIQQDKSTFPKQMLEKLNCVRVGFYPNEADNFAIFDYSLSTDLTNYLLVIMTNENGNIVDVTMES